MGLPAGWVTEAGHGLTQNQQITALGNGVLPLQALVALDICRAPSHAPQRAGAQSAPARLSANL